MLYRIQEFHHCTRYIGRKDLKRKMRVEQKYDDDHCIVKEYPMKDETKESEIQAQTFKKSYIFVQHFSVSYCYNIAHAQTTLCRKSCSDGKDCV